MKYRDHRASLEDSMATERILRSFDEIKDYLLKKSDGWGDEEIEEIWIKYYGFDPRINWDTYLVIGMLKNKKEYPFGFMALEPHEYICAMCDELFHKGSSDEEATRGSVKNFGVEMTFQDKQLLVCDDCFKKIDPAQHPDKVQAALKEFNKTRN